MVSLRPRFPTIVLANEACLMRRVMGDTLAAEYEVLETRSGAELLHLVHERQPDLVLVDSALLGVAGAEVCARLRNRSPRSAVRVVLMSSLGERDLARRATAVGADGFIAKPLLLTRLRRFVQVCLRTPGRGPDLTG